jgi:hypothetical protein
MQDNQKQTLWAYIAGIMDADGCFMIMKHARKTKRSCSKYGKVYPITQENWSGTYLPALKIAMIEPEAVEFIKNETGFGTYRLEGTRKSRPNSKPIYQWYERNKRKVIPFLINVLPFLKVKKERALHLLEFCKHLNDCKNPGYRGIAFEELNYREQMYVKMRELNGNKVAATTKSQRRENVSDSLDS